MEEIQKVTYELPTSVDTDVFGPAYWAAFHDLASKVPCGACREKMESIMIFVHDLVNLKTEKPLYNKDNFFQWLKIISQIKNKPIKIK